MNGNYFAVILRNSTGLAMVMTTFAYDEHEAIRHGAEHAAKIKSWGGPEFVTGEAHEVNFKWCVLEGSEHLAGEPIEGLGYNIRDYLLNGGELVAEVDGRMYHARAVVAPEEDQSDDFLGYMYLSCPEHSSLSVETILEPLDEAHVIDHLTSVAVKFHAERGLGGKPSLTVHEGGLKA